MELPECSVVLSSYNSLLVLSRDICYVTFAVVLFPFWECFMSLYVIFKIQYQFIETFLFTVLTLFKKVVRNWGWCWDKNLERTDSLRGSLRATQTECVVFLPPKWPSRDSVILLYQIWCFLLRSYACIAQQNQRIVWTRCLDYSSICSRRLG